jgi:hypothetical protein
MWTNLIHSSADYGIVAMSLVVLVFIVNRLGLIAWFAWVSRRKDTKQDSSTRKYWSAHE